MAKCQECGEQAPQPIEITFWDTELDEEVEATLCGFSCAIKWLGEWDDAEHESEVAD